MLEMVLSLTENYATQWQFLGGSRIVILVKKQKRKKKNLFSFSKNHPPLDGTIKELVYKLQFTWYISW